jgi:hypothetical protein
MLKKASYRVDSVLFVGHVSAEVMVRLFQDLLKVRRDVGVKDRVAVAVLDATYPQKYFPPSQCFALIASFIRSLLFLLKFDFFL